MGSIADIHAVAFGTGFSTYQSRILAAIESAEFEVILVTCFWAKSRTLDALNESLLRLSGSVRSRNRKIRIRIGFSSSSISQKIFHTSSPTGRIYTPSERTKKLGLPGIHDLPGLDLEIKSKFFLPFSVWHPKFVIIDRKRVFLPSCNVSWEDWFEGCVEMSGPIVRNFTTFWREYWATSDDEFEQTEMQFPSSQRGNLIHPGVEGEVASQAHVLCFSNVECKFLPSPHHRNPNFRFPFQKYALPPRTPLNMQLLDLLDGARQEIHLYTPNLTSPPVLHSIRNALQRGIDVKIVSSEKLMVLEQIITAGTTTARCMNALRKYHQQLLEKRPDEETGLVHPGRLHISYYAPLSVSRSGITGDSEPVKLHLKLTVVDKRAIVFGSGNMDRASWYTSQELGVLFFSNDLSVKTLQQLQFTLQNRTKVVYDGNVK